AISPSPALPPVPSRSFVMLVRPARSTLFPYTTLFRSLRGDDAALRPRCGAVEPGPRALQAAQEPGEAGDHVHPGHDGQRRGRGRSEEHTSELQSRENLVCRLLLEKKNNVINTSPANVH